MRLQGLSALAIRRVSQALAFGGTASEEDIIDALSRVESVFGMPINSLSAEMFNITFESEFDYRDLAESVVYENGGWEFGEIASVDEDGWVDTYEIEKHLSEFRGDRWASRAISWLESGFPPIVVVLGVPAEAVGSAYSGIDPEEIDSFYEICDGFGRATMAYGLGLASIPATILTAKDPFTESGSYLTGKIGYSFRRHNAALKRKAMPFLAKPPVDQTYKGIIEYPGFHTTGDFDIAAAYAVGRVMNSFTEEDENGVNFVTDYPVVVKLAMTKFTPVTDYDAEEMVRDPLISSLDELMSEYGIDEGSEDEDIIDAAQELLEFSDYGDDDTSGSAVDIAMDEKFSHFGNPFRTIVDSPAFPEWVREYAATGEFSQEMLMAATDQYRYEDDVDEENILEVYYVTPTAGEEYDYHRMEENEMEAFEARWPGFDLLTVDDVGSHSFSGDLVWQNPDPVDGGQLPLFPELYPEDQREEFHGTTYKRLLSAAPFLAEVLPVPPEPYREVG